MSATLWIGANCFAQEEQDPQKPIVSATVKGRIAQNQDEKFEIDIAELKPALFQQLELPQPPVPKNWPELKLEQRQAWIKKFESSDQGKAFLENRKKLIESAGRFDLKVEPNGNFVVYDVPHGRYGLRGQLEKTFDDQTYVLEVFGQIDIEKEVEEVLLDPMMVSVTRLLRRGEQIPQFEMSTFDDKTRINNRLLASPQVNQKHVLFSFWSMESPPSKEFAKSIQQMYSSISAQHDIQLISVCVGSDPKEALNFVKTMRVRGWHGYVKSWDDEMINEFGVRVLPALILASPTKQVVMSHSDFRRAFQNGESNLSTIIVDAMTGKNIPTLADDDSSPNNNP